MRFGSALTKVFGLAIYLSAVAERELWRIEIGLLALLQVARRMGFTCGWAALAAISINWQRFSQ